MSAQSSIFEMQFESSFDMKLLVQRCKKDLGESFLGYILYRIEHLDKCHHTLRLETSPQNPPTHTTITRTTQFMETLFHSRAARARILYTLFHGLTCTSSLTAVITTFILALLYLETRVDHSTKLMQKSGTLEKFVVAGITAAKFHFDEDVKMCKTTVWMLLLRCGMEVTDAEEDALRKGELWMAKAMRFRYWIRPDEFATFEQEVVKGVERCSLRVDHRLLALDGRNLGWMRPTLQFAQSASNLSPRDPNNVLWCTPPIPSTSSYTYSPSVTQATTPTSNPFYAKAQALTTHINHTFAITLLCPHASSSIYEGAMHAHAFLARLCVDRYWVSLANILRIRHSDDAARLGYTAPSDTAKELQKETERLWDWAEMSQHAGNVHWAFMMKWAQSVYWTQRPYPPEWDSLRDFVQFNAGRVEPPAQGTLKRVRAASMGTMVPSKKHLAGAGEMLVVPRYPVELQQLVHYPMAHSDDRLQDNRQSCHEVEVFAIAAG
ncbi:uncharacterized protein SPPG_04847 [Spizellomyces punctatus DAOM BR117]|uniref:Uncharacterized protein n=1 Tax=Spizellomyces punctatus (strain DAOM BR117) TaxID=645134 RepID=A0A0L0HI79_SPIPD|nr:uncharacterized protein SPPG_04847 [Spizellomyces punctatus DAOM BR117]KND00539.1 hypothetical protein SPPG_04847 [Spizellomyces punctatus DAOM BR117]|eukprot:XP_016608578.1 hypothetical protein SPPG_04847 [Spizellomyces punctatus DAOM BR117]